MIFLLLQINNVTNVDENHLPKQIIFAVFLVLGTVLLLWYIFRRGIMCSFCGSSIKVWSRISEEQQKKVLDYFTTHEKREPNTSRILVCEKCKTVFDDFYEERGIGDNHVISGFTDNEKTIIMCKTYCKVCNCIIPSCDPEKEKIDCRKCGTEYHWKTHEPSGLRFLTPPEDVEVLKKCSLSIDT